MLSGLIGKRIACGLSVIAFLAMVVLFSKAWHEQREFKKSEEIRIRDDSEELIIEWLRSRQGGVNRAVETKWTHAFPKEASPLLLAAYWGRTEVVRFLLDQGVDVNQGDEGQTPLFWAAQNRHLRAVCVILEREPRNLDDAAFVAGWDERIVIEREIERRTLRERLGHAAP